MAKKITDLKPAIVQSLSLFHDSNTTNAISNFYQTLGYSSELNYELDNVTPHDFMLMINSEGGNDKRLLLNEWQSVDYLFQLTEEQIKNVVDIPEFNINYINSYLFLTITLTNNYYSRTQLSSITREINRLSAIPIMLTFKHGSSLTIAIIDRRPNQKDTDKDVLQKITLIKDINFIDTHRAHLEILNDFALSNIIKRDKPESFDDLHKAWHQILSTSELNKKFYREVSNWYFWAVKTVQFPLSDDEKTNNPTNIIRLITRLIFVWFLKEKGLINPELFKPQSVHQLLVSLDDEESSYYKAILQNLFFGTLNRPMGEKNRQFGSAYLYEQYFQDTEQFLNLCRDIPFLNGGLFECLDKNDKLIDGFSEAGDNPLDLPNKLFFGQPEEMDLSAVYGRKRKKEYIRGIIHIFNDYKFTIDENTSIDEEIALDPELLGKVFENLLAEYNPETETTARKQTGSFYTPREIVNYMVDESVIAYLKQQVMDKLGGNEEQLESQLREILSFSEINPFANSPDVVRVLITAIDNMKILDPACGSGAFPMGILQKLVHILSKLDPDNQRWRNQQKERAIAPLLEDIKQAQKISYEEAREQAISQLETRLKQIEDEFDNNEQDYPRKLFLIENCIYGVDIQPIAVQISKLRFFISLIVEQKVNESLDNRGILPLPNLETKFVCANTLIGVDNQMSIRSDEVITKEAQLRQVRHDYFSANNLQDKQRCKQLDKQLRTEITTLLKNTGLQGAIADTLARWNPYDQNDSSDFFDSEWMFGVNSFDIVIGNPPYVRQEAIKELKPQFQKQYSCYTGVADLYVYFYEQGLRLLKNNGYLTYITPNKYFRAGYGQKLRQYLTQNSRIEILIDFGDANVFEATAYPSIILSKKYSNSDNQDIKVLNWDENKSLNDFKIIYEKDKFLVPQKSLTADGWRLESSKILNLLDKLKNAGTPLGEYVNGRLYYGIKTGFNEAFIVDQETRDKLINEHESSAEVLKPFLRGRDVKRWCVEKPDLWLLFIPWHFPLHNDSSISGASQNAEKALAKDYPAIYSHLLKYKDKLSARNKAETGIRYEWYALQRCAATYFNEIEKNKIIYPNICKRNEFAWDKHGFFVNQKAFMIPTNSKYLLGILNSSIMMWLFDKLLAKLQNGFYEPSSIFMKNMPIPKATEAEKEVIEQLVQKCLDAKGVSCEEWEKEIDDRVAHLYGLTEDDMRIIKH